MSNTPTDAEIDEVTLDVLGYAALDKETNDTARMIARAVLAKWGTPQPVVREPLKRVATIKSWTNGSYWRNYNVEWHSDALVEGTQLYAEIPAHGITQKGGS